MRSRSLHSTVTLTVLASGMVLGACGETASGTDADDTIAETWPDGPIEVEPAPLCTDRQISIRHVAAWPGNGVGVRVRVTTATVEESGLLAESAVELGSTVDDVVPATVATAAAEPGYVMLVVDSSVDLHATTAAEVVAALPEGTRVALFQRCALLRQVTGVTSDRARLVEMLEYPIVPCGDTSAPWASTMAEAADEAFRVGGRIFPAERAVVVVTDAAPSDPFAFADLPMGVDGYVLAPGAGGLTLPAGFEGFDLDAGVAESVAERIRLRAGLLVDVGACLPATAGAEVDMRFASGVVCPLAIPSAPDEQRSRACDPSAIAAGVRQAPARIEFTFTPAERAVFDQNYADKAHEDFRVTVTIGDADAVSAVAHLRGATSMNCKRKSFTVDLDGGAQRVLGPGFAGDEFHLISMCNDEHYFQQFTANQLMASLSLFPLHFELTELVIDGETWGIYELLEKPKEALLRSTSRLRTIVRRRNDYVGQASDVKYPNGADIDSPQVAAYRDLYEKLTGLKGEELVAETRSRIDLDRYLTFVAMHSLLQTGDFADETWFYSTESALRVDLDEWFQIHAWDMDDLYAACHNQGQYAIDDPFGLLFCAEGKLEKLLLVDDSVYPLFVDALDRLIGERLNENSFDAALEETAARLLPFFDRPGVPAAMVELVKQDPAAVDGPTAKADIRAAIDKTKVDFHTRRDELLDLIAHWRQAR